MAHRVRGVIARSRGAPVEVVSVHVPDPGPGEALVRVVACGVCHTDLHYREGGIGDDFPYLLGHEAAGRVESVGPGVHNVSRGEAVVIAWRAPCGTCRSCRRGRPWYCFDSRNARQRMSLDDGTELTAALGIGAFAELCLVDAGQVVPVDPAVRPEAAALIGCGGVANAAIAGASIAGARLVIGVDVVERKLEWARQFGATHTINARDADPVEAIRALTDGFGADLVIDAVGRPETYLQAFLARDHAGRLVNVGVPPEQGMTVELPMSEIFGRGGSLRSSWYGDCLPTRDFPVLIDLHRRGRLNLDGFVSETIGLDDIEAAFTRIVGGEVLRSVVVFAGT